MGQKDKVQKIVGSMRVLDRVRMQALHNSHKIWNTLSRKKNMSHLSHKKMKIVKREEVKKN